MFSHRLPRIRDYRDLHLLRDTGGRESRRIRRPSYRRVRMRALVILQNTIDAIIFDIGLEPAGAARLVRLVWGSPRFAPAEWHAEFVGAGVFAAGELAHRRDDQGADAGDRGGDDDNDVFDVSPAE